MQYDKDHLLRLCYEALTMYQTTMSSGELFNRLEAYEENREERKAAITGGYALREVLRRLPVTGDLPLEFDASQLKLADFRPEGYEE